VKHYRKEAVLMAFKMAKLKSIVVPVKSRINRRNYINLDYSISLEFRALEDGSYVVNVDGYRNVALHIHRSLDYWRADTLLWHSSKAWLGVEEVEERYANEQAQSAEEAYASNVHWLLHSALFDAAQADLESYLSLPVNDTDDTWSGITWSRTKEPLHLAMMVDAKDL